MTPLVLCPRYEQGEAERGGPGAESRSWQRDSGEQGVGQRPQNRHSAPGPANPRHPPRPPTPAGGTSLLEKDSGKEGGGHQPHHPPATSCSPGSFPEARAAPEPPPPKGSPASQALGSCRQTGGGWHRAHSVPGTAGSLLITRARLSCLPWP